MKKIGKLTLTLAMLLALTGCGSRKEDTGSTSAAQATTQAALGTENGSTATGASEETTEKAAEEKVWVFKKGDVTIHMDDPAEPIISALGTYQDKFEAPSCAFDGMDTVYSYPGFEVMTYKAKDTEKVSGVVLRDDTVETMEGLFIGSSAEDVAKKYGESVEGKNNLNLTKGNSDLLFIFKDGVVTSIQYSIRADQ